MAISKRHLRTAIARLGRHEEAIELFEEVWAVRDVDPERRNRVWFDTTEGMETSLRALGREAQIEPWAAERAKLTDPDAD
ncbi:MAG: hypothetical protein AAF628_23680 [Planctomycetota bacterium]